MKEFKKLTLKRIQERHEKNPQDTEIHEQIEKGIIEKEKFDSMVEKAGQQEAFDKKQS